MRKPAEGWPGGMLRPAGAVGWRETRGTGWKEKVGVDEVVGLG